MIRSLSGAGPSFGIGCFQVLALLPGLSRSGATISGARLLGWDRNQAAKFSFLLAIPTICGAMLVEGKEFFFHPDNFISLPSSIYFIGFISSFLSGFLALKVFLHLIKQNRLVPFAVYCAIIGCITINYLGHPLH